MTARELIEELERFDDDMEIIMQPSGSGYADTINRVNIEELRPFYGARKDVLVLQSGGQVGSI